MIVPAITASAEEGTTHTATDGVDPRTVSGVEELFTRYGHGRILLGMLGLQQDIGCL